MKNSEHPWEWYEHNIGTVVPVLPLSLDLIAGLLVSVTDAHGVQLGFFTPAFGDISTARFKRDKGALEDILNIKYGRQHGG